jgi:hypothetical protein
VRRAKQNGGVGEGEGIGVQVTSVRDAVHDGCLKKGCHRRKSQPKVEKRERGEFRIDVSGDLDRDDWLPDLHRDTALSQPPSLHSQPCSTFEQLRTSADLLAFKGLLGKPIPC